MGKLLRIDHQNCARTGRVERARRPLRRHAAPQLRAPRNSPMDDDTLSSRPRPRIDPKNQFATSADGRLQGFPRMPPPEGCPIPRRPVPLSASQGAMQGTIAHGGKMQNSMSELRKDAGP